jgi:hypothetical protein
MSYIGNTPTLTTRIDYIFVSSQGQLTFSGTDSNNLVLSYNPSNVDIFANGVLLPRSDFVANDSSSVILSSARNSGDVITVRAYGIPDSINALLPGKVDVSSAGILSSFRNKIMNGNFDLWQRGTTQTTSGYGAADRWLSGNSGSTKTTSLQSFTLGQTDVPGNPTYFCRTVVSSVAGTGNFVNFSQSVEGVQTLSGKTATLTFYAKADASRPMGVEFAQNFGSSGSPSSPILGIGATKVNLTTSWARYDVVVSIPSITGKTLGTDTNNLLFIGFWFDAGSSYNLRSASLGQQSGTFDIARVSLVEGDARSDLNPFSERHPHQELALCERYYQVMPGTYYAFSAGGTATVRRYQITFRNPMRASPSVSWNSGDTFYVDEKNNKMIRWYTDPGSNAGERALGTIICDAEL